MYKNLTGFTACYDKFHIFWEGHKILRNLHLTFDYSTCYSQKLGEDFAKFYGLLRIYELYQIFWLDLENFYVSKPNFDRCMGPSFHQKKSLCWHLTMHLVSIQFGEIDYIASIEKPFSIKGPIWNSCKKYLVVIDSNIYKCTWFYLF